MWKFLRHGEKEITRKMLTLNSQKLDAAHDVDNI